MAEGKEGDADEARLLQADEDLAEQISALLALLPADIVRDLNEERIHLGDEGFLEAIVDHLQRNKPSLLLDKAIGAHLRNAKKKMGKVLRAEFPDVDHTSTVRKKEKTIGRNDRCPCGSGKKFKTCCLHKKR